MSVQPETELLFQLTSPPSNVKQSITVTNSHPDASIAFKVKTTAPRLYSVKPSSGKLDPGAQCQVQILLQFKDEIKADVRKDKFLIQSIKIPPTVLKLEGEALQSRIQELWTQAEQISKSVADGGSDIIAQKKLRCLISPPLGDNEPSPEPTKRQSTTVHDFKDPDTPFPKTGHVINLVTETIQEEAAIQRSEMEALLLQAQEKLKTVQAACDGYKSELDRVNHLRQRRSDNSSSGNLKTLARTPAPQGFPLPVVVVIALLSFLIGAWLF